MKIKKTLLMILGCMAIVSSAFCGGGPDPVYVPVTISLPLKNTDAFDFIGGVYYGAVSICNVNREYFSEDKTISFTSKDQDLSNFVFESVPADREVIVEAFVFDRTSVDKPNQGEYPLRYYAEKKVRIDPKGNNKITLELKDFFVSENWNELNLRNEKAGLSLNLSSSGRYSISYSDPNDDDPDDLVFTYVSQGIWTKVGDTYHLREIQWKDFYKPLFGTNPIRKSELVTYYNDIPLEIDQVKRSWVFNGTNGSNLSFPASLDASKSSDTKPIKPKAAPTKPKKGIQQLKAKAK